MVKNDWNKFVSDLELEVGQVRSIDRDEYPYLSIEFINKYNELVNLHSSVLDKVRAINDTNRKNRQILETKSGNIGIAIAILFFVIAIAISFYVIGTFNSAMFAVLFIALWLSQGVYSISSNSYYKSHFKEVGLEDIKDYGKMLDDLRAAIKSMDTKIEIENRRHLEYWKGLNGWQFEKEVADVFARNGYEAVVTKGSGDGGIDILLTQGERRIIVQCKNHGKAVGPHTVRDLYGTLINSPASEAMLVSASGFTSGVHDFIVDKPIHLLDIQDLIKMN